jgi:hypothetical protein
MHVFRTFTKSISLWFVQRWVPAATPYRDCHAICDPNGYVYADAYQNVDVNAEPNSVQDGYVYGHTECDQYTVIDDDVHGHPPLRDRHADPDVYGHVYTEQLADGYANIQHDVDAQCHIDADQPADVDTDSE